MNLSHSGCLFPGLRQSRTHSGSRRPKQILLCLFGAFALAACGSDPSASVERDRAPRIFASNYPLAYFAERLSGRPDLVYFPAIEGDPAMWKPSAEEIPEIQNAALILLNGAAYEKWAGNVTLPESRIIDTTAAMKESLLKIDGVVTHTHGPDGDHSHEGTAFTTWLDFTQASQQAEVIKAALLKANIAEPQQLDAAFKELEADLLSLDTDLRNLTAKNPSQPLVASHPVYDYLARRYNLNLQSVLWEPNVFPSEDEWNDLAALLREHPAKWMLWEDRPLDESVRRLEEMGIRSVVVNPCANTPGNGDFLSVMRRNIENLQPVFAK